MSIIPGMDMDDLELEGTDNWDKENKFNLIIWYIYCAQHFQWDGWKKFHFYLRIRRPFGLLNTIRFIHLFFFYFRIMGYFIYHDLCMTIMMLNFNFWEESLGKKSYRKDQASLIRCKS